jgi:hypothetical protein
MFNSYRSSYVNTSPEHVHEHRAPTDASVRLLVEMEAKMRERVLAAYPVENTLLKFTTVLLERDDRASFGPVLVVRYQLGGGQVREFRESLFGLEREALQKVLKKFSEHVGESVLLELVETRPFARVVQEVLRKKAVDANE